MISKTAIVCLALGVAIVYITDCTAQVGTLGGGNNTTTTTTAPQPVPSNLSSTEAPVTTQTPNGNNTRNGDGGNSAGRFAVPSLFTMMSILCSILYGVTNQF